MRVALIPVISRRINWWKDQTGRRSTFEDPTSIDCAHCQSGLKGASSARVTSPKVLVLSQEMAVINDQIRAFS